MHYFEKRLSHGFVSLFSSKAIINIAAGLFGVFLPIFLYNLFKESISSVAMFYLISSLIYGLVVAFGAKFLNKFGFRRALKWSTFFGALYYLGFLFLNESNVWFMIPVIIVIIVLYRILYWVPYHVDFAKFTNSKDRGKEVSLLASTISIIGALTPLIAGIIISRFGYNVLFLIGVILYLCSFIPYITIPRTKERFSWTYKKTWKNFFAKENRSTVLVFMSDGAEGMVGLVLWPIFIFQILNGNYLKVGLLSTFVVGATIILQIVVGKYCDKKNLKEKFIKYGSWLYALGWLAKIFVATFFHVFIVDVYHNLTKIFTRIPFDALTYEIAADQGHYVDEYTVLHEMAIAFGKVLMLAFIVVLAPFISLNWLFILAFGASLIMGFLRIKTQKRLKRC
jgi:MFS family permease